MAGASVLVALGCPSNGAFFPGASLPLLCLNTVLTLGAVRRGAVLGAFKRIRQGLGRFSTYHSADLLAVFDPERDACPSCCGCQFFQPAFFWGDLPRPVAGFGSGLLGTAIAFDGPPVGAYGLCMGWEPRVLLGTLGVFFVLRATVTLVLQGMAGFYTPTVLTCAMYGAPGVILGTCIAFPVVKHISQQAFRKVLLCVIAVAGLVCLVRALG